MEIWESRFLPRRKPCTSRIAHALTVDEWRQSGHQDEDAEYGVLPQDCLDEAFPIKASDNPGTTP
jgi:hypothetical protein